MTIDDVPRELRRILDAMRAEQARPLVVAARDGDPTAVTRELPGADPDTRALALEAAAAHARTDVIELLLAAGVPVHGAAMQRAHYGHHRHVLARLLATHPPDAARSDAFVSVVLDDDHESVDVFLDAGLLPDDARDTVLRLGSDAMRRRWRIRPRRRR